MDKLFEGAIKFKKEDFETHKHLFKELGRQQHPHTLFVGCVDSRVVPNMITKTDPGELFTVRNVANLVPPYRISEGYPATTAAIEYAVEVLGVKTIIVCGHSNCGGCAAMHKPAEELSHIPNVKKWLDIAGDVVGKVELASTENSPEEREWLTEQINIVDQMQHLLSYPYVLEKFRAGEIDILGWYYIIETGEIYNYNREKREFELLS